MLGFQDQVGAVDERSSERMNFRTKPRIKQAIQQATEKAQQLAKDPKTRAKIDGVRRRIQGGRGGTGAGPAV